MGAQIPFQPLVVALRNYKLNELNIEKREVLPYHINKYIFIYTCRLALFFTFFWTPSFTVKFINVLFLYYLLVLVEKMRQKTNLFQSYLMFTCIDKHKLQLKKLTLNCGQAEACWKNMAEESGEMTKFISILRCTDQKVVLDVRKCSVVDDEYEKMIRIKFGWKMIFF